MLRVIGIAYRAVARRLGLHPNRCDPLFVERKRDGEGLVKVVRLPPLHRVQHNRSFPGLALSLSKHLFRKLQPHYPSRDIPLKRGEHVSLAPIGPDLQRELNETGS